MGRVEELLAALDAEERASLLAGADVWHTPAVPRLGIGAIRMSDGPAGARGTTFAEGLTSALVPCATLLGATFDVELVERVGRLLGEEVRAKGAQVHLAPTVNLHRTPLGGRAFECFSEDPELSARMAVAYVRGVQSVGVASCVKHLVANDQETDRMTISAEVEEGVLRSTYLRPFEAAVREGGAWAVMSAYNKLGGTWCGEHRWLLTEVLKEGWGFDGAVISDWWGTHSGAASIEAGLDVEMPGPALHRTAEAAAQADPAAVEEAVRRVLRLAERTGALDRPAGALDPPPERSTGAEPATRALLREAAAAGLVLLRNGGGVLPLPAGARVAVIGPNADALHAQGGGSAHVTPPAVPSVLDELRAAGLEVVHEAGCRPASTPWFDPRRTQVQLQVVAEGGAEGPWRDVVEPRFVAMGGAPEEARLRIAHEAAATGEHVLELRAAGHVDVVLDGAQVVDADVAGRHRTPVALEVGRRHHLEVSFRPGGSAGPFAGIAFCELRLAPPEDPDRLARAVAAAASADVAVVVVGLTDDLESEGRDRRSPELPAEQVELIGAVAAAQPRTVVVVNAGSVVDLAWADEVAGLLLAWCPGQEGGGAIADVLTGAADPGGRLPTTVPSDWSTVPPIVAGERVVYEEGELVGHRRPGPPPRFRFGDGLSYARFEEADLADGAVRVTNVGARPGSHVVRRHDADGRLLGFAKAHLAPGASIDLRPGAPW